MTVTMTVTLWPTAEGHIMGTELGRFAGAALARVSYSRSSYAFTETLVTPSRAG
jgi:hypothetical protein